MNEEEARQLCLDLLRNSEAAYLTTIDGNGFPQTRAMVNLRNTKQFPELSNLFNKQSEALVTYFATNAASNKIKQIKRNQAVSVYYCDINARKGLMLGGLIEIITNSALKKQFWQDRWKKHYPGGVDDPHYILLRLCPVIAKCCHQISTFELNLKRKQ